MHVTTMLSSAETADIRGIGQKIRLERPYLTCRGDEVDLALFIALFDSGRMLLSKTGGTVKCGGRQTSVSADVLLPIALALSREVQRSSEIGANFLPGDQYMPKREFTSSEYGSGAMRSPLSAELGVDLDAGPLYLVTMVAKSRQSDVTSTPWVVLARRH